MSKADRIVAWIEGLNNLMLRRALLHSWMLVVGVLCIPVARRLTVIPVSGPDFILGVVGGTVVGVLIGLWCYMLIAPTIRLKRALDLLRDELEKESTDDLLERWEDASLFARERIAQVLRMRDEPQAQRFLFGEVRFIAPEWIDLRRDRLRRIAAHERTVTRLFTRFGSPLVALFAMSVLLTLAASFLQIEGRADQAAVVQDLSGGLLWACVPALIALFTASVWSFGRSDGKKGQTLGFSTDARLFEAWKEGHDAALRRLLTPGFRATDPAVREFVAKLNLGAQPAKSGAGSLWPLIRPSDDLEAVLSD